ncbi:nickel-dependent hydrogenase large subunit [Methanospirillum stamsii]|uniref:NADH dehydrogenase subunit n=1 Tax=Methanospirillum stamsii TaxID=1277351 RepID=A0A2V2NCP8_9EURY|nr:nickel-dependent hydrogenase large subunit [Methanospirillum stamsii]PWR75386.1 NADH dehydrogenase subunit [Methanospirillum stamsii]
MSQKKAPYELPIGPIHPALKEPINFTFKMNGEVVEEVDFAPGRAHRGIEWMGMRRNPVQILHLCDRICGICGVAHALVFAQAVEQIAGVEVPDRAYYVRTIIAEFERIQSHLLWAGVAAHELGFDTLFYLAWQIREESVDVIEYITGNRVNYAIMMIGGTRRDITPDMFPRIEQALQYYEGLFEKMVNLFLNDKTIAMRCRNTGILTKRRALELATVGPTARASGLAMDVRTDSPYAAYGDLDFDIILPEVYSNETVGDVYDRIVVRIFEVKQSIDIIRQCLRQMPDGPVLAEEKYPKLLMNLKKASGEAFARVEAPRGEDMHFVRMNGKQEAPEMWKVKASTYSNQMAWIEILQGEQIADIPVIIASIDPCMSCTDRVAVVNQKGEADVLTKEYLHRLSVEKTRRMQG